MATNGAMSLRRCANKLAHLRLYGSHTGHTLQQLRCISQSSDITSGPHPSASLDSLAGKTCFVQGASRGLGAEYVKQLLGLQDTR
eukprot:jgi/Chrzof1/5765/Cz16g15020.t1